MMIGKFHKLIQSRLLWAVFLVVIVFSFVIWGMQMQGEERTERGQAPGLLDGKPVSFEEYRAAQIHSEISLRLIYGELPRTVEVNRMLRRNAWERLALLRLARELDIQVSDDEVLQALAQERSFHRNGRFDRDLYLSQIRGFLGDIRWPVSTFEETIRQDLALRQLIELIGGASLVAPYEVERRLATLTDRFDLYLISITAADLPDLPASTEEHLQAFFAANVARYRIPETRTIRLVRFVPDPDSDEQPPPDEWDLKDYYEEHLAEFWTKGSEDGSETNDASAMRLQTFDEVRPQLVERVRRDLSIVRARRNGERFAQLVSPIRPDTAPLSFDAAADAMGVNPMEVGPISTATRPGETVLTAPALRAAMSLSEDEIVSPATTDGESTVVLTLASRTPSRLPELDEVRDRVLEDVREDARRGALMRKGGALKAAAETARSLAAAAEGMGLTGKSLEQISAISAMDMDADSDMPITALLDALRSLRVGEISNPLASGPEGVVVLQVLNRTAAPESDLSLYRDQVADMLHEQLIAATQRELAEYLLRPSRFKNLMEIEDEEE